MSRYNFYYTIGTDEWRPSLLTYDVPILLPASSYARYRLRRVRMPAHITDRAADSGGFIATFKWGDYKYSPEEYANWLYGWMPTWAATMDYCCEDEITNGRHGVVRERQEKTTEKAHLFWQEFRDCPWPWVPTIQGWDIEDYRWHAQQLRPLILEMQAHYGEQSAFRVGIGTLCRRINVQLILAILLTVAQELPEVNCFHLWGVKKTFWQQPLAFPFRVSSDSASWNMQGYYGDFNPEWKRWKAEQALLGFEESNRTHRYKVLIPRTQAEIEAVQRQPRQRVMF